MGRQAGLTLAGGGSVIANAVFDRAADRERIEHVARRSALPFQGFWLEAAPDLLRKRVEQRKQGQCTSVPPTRVGV
jgi:predicted kinase